MTFGSKKAEERAVVVVRESGRSVFCSCPDVTFISGAKSCETVARLPAGGELKKGEEMAGHGNMIERKSNASSYGKSIFEEGIPTRKGPNIG